MTVNETPSRSGNEEILRRLRETNEIPLRSGSDDDIKEFIATKLGDLLTDEHQINLSLYKRKQWEAEEGFELLEITASISHPEFESFGVNVTFRIPKL